MVMINMCVGGTTDTTARFVAKVTTGPVRIKYSVNADMTSASFSGSTAVSNQVAKVTITGLTANTRYYWQVEDNSVIDTSATGQFKTHPVASGTAASFTIGVSACAGTTVDYPGGGTELDPDRISNAPVFDTVREQALADGWLMFCHLGDLHYYDFGDLNTDTVANRRTSYDDVLSQSRQHQLYREVAWLYLWDDHDFGPDDSDGTYANKANPAQVYRERVPHYDLAEGSGSIYHSFQIGRVLFIASDVRYNRSDNSATDNSSKTMLGSTQKTWLTNLLDTSTADFLVWLMPSQWAGGSDDSWASFTTERAELVTLLDTHGWLDRMVMVNGDRHAINIDDGTLRNADNGGFPVYVFAPLDSTPTVAESFDALWSHGGHGGRGQYGTIRVDDNGTDIAVTATGYIQGEPWQWHTTTLSSTVLAARRRGPKSHVLAL